MIHHRACIVPLPAMGTEIRFTPLSGALSEGPLCYLLELDGFTFLLDCGWSEGFDVADLEHLKA